MVALTGKGHNVHGNKGAYVGGEWVDIEDCAEKFNIKGGSNEKCTKQCSRCPRSRTRHSAAREDGTYDVVIVGAGCIGAAVARELSRTTASVLMLEAADDVTQGATKGNSGIVHAGFDDKPGTNRSRFCPPGNQMFPQLDKELHFGYEKTGSLVIAKDEKERKVLDELMERGKVNGVPNLRIVEKKELFEMEPNIHPDTIAALHAADAGSLIPYEYAIALAENAADNGVEVRIRREVEAIERTDLGFDVKVRHWEPAGYVSKGLATLPAAGISAAATLVAAVALHGLEVEDNLKMIIFVCMFPLVFLAMRFMPKAAPKTVGDGPGFNVASWISAIKVGGSGSAACVKGATVETETIKTRYVVNCAGVASDIVARMIGDESFKIKPRLGEYLLLHKNQGNKTNHIIFPTPDPVKGKGVLVQKTLWGNLILGPTARDTYDELTVSESLDDIMTFILKKCRELVPSFDATETIHSFSGARAKSSRGDWIIEPSAADSRGKFINCAGIDSPGVAGSPAIAVHVVELLEKAGLKVEKDPSFNPLRAPIIVPKDGRNLKYSKTEADAKGADPKKNVVCKCEKVTEAEIVEALRRSLPLDSTQSMRKRTRAGMGHCQGDPANYDCETRVANIIARETGLPPSAVGRRPWPATSMLPGRWPSNVQKKAIEQLGK
jgi:L-2-hydroxyglutarate oxidase LhgO